MASNRNTGHLPLKMTGTTLFLLVVVALVAVGGAALVVSHPGPLVAIAVTVVLGYFLISRPETATLLVLFILYTNAAVVAVKFHGVPKVAALAVPVLLLLPLAYYLWNKREKIILPGIVPWIFVFEFVRLISAMFSERPDVSTEVMLTSVTEGMGLYLLLVNVIRTPEMIRRSCWVLVAAGAFLGGINTYQHLSKDYKNSFGGFGQNLNKAAFKVDKNDPSSLQPRLEGPIGEQNFYAQCMLMLLPLAMFRGFSESRYSLKAAAGIGGMFILFGIILTFSRGALLGCGVVFLGMVFLRRITLKQFGMLLVCGALVLAFVPQFQTRLKSFERLFTLVSPEGGGMATADRSTQGRLTEMISAGLVFADHPALGVGPGMFKYHFLKYANATGRQVHTEARAAHNLYLQIAAECGIIGIISFLAILFLTMRELYIGIKTSADPQLVNLATGLLLALIGFSATSFFLDYAYIRFFWVIMALAGATGYQFSVNARVDSGLKEQTTPSVA